MARVETEACATSGARSSSDRTLLDKVWDRHVIVRSGEGEDLLYVDLNVLHEGGTFLAFNQLRRERRAVRSPAQHIAVEDHYVPTRPRSAGLAAIRDANVRNVVMTLRENCAQFGIEHIPMDDPRHGISHVIGPELGLTQPGLLITCCDSHTATHGAFGALAIPIGQSNQLRHVLATQTLWQQKPKSMRVAINGVMPSAVTAKDAILTLIASIGIGGAAGHAIEYCGSAIDAMSMEERMTVCNMSVEAGARIGMIAPDGKTYDYLNGRSGAPRGAHWERAVDYWRALASDAHAVFDREIVLDAASFAPMVSWGTTPEECLAITACVPDPGLVDDANRRTRMERALAYMKLAPGTPLEGIGIDRVFIGSCTNGRIEDLRVAASVLKGRQAVVPAIVSPGSESVRRQAEREGLARIFQDAGFDWRHSGCSMCTGTNGDLVGKGERSASTTNRNFEGRQGPGALTHIMSPPMAVAAAMTGRLTDVRTL